jgi:hypothetical protein
MPRIPPGYLLKTSNLHSTHWENSCIRTNHSQPYVSLQSQIVLLTIYIQSHIQPTSYTDRSTTSLVQGGTFHPTRSATAKAKRYKWDRMQWSYLTGQCD